MMAIKGARGSLWLLFGCGGGGVRWEVGKKLKLKSGLRFVKTGEKVGREEGIGVGRRGTLAPSTLTFCLQW